MAISSEHGFGTRRRAAVRAATVLGLVAGCVALALAPVGTQSDRSAQGAAAPGQGAVPGFVRVPQGWALADVGGVGEVSDERNPRSDGLVPCPVTAPQAAPRETVGGNSRATAGTGGETLVYENSFQALTWYFAPGAGAFMADDLLLAGNVREFVRYDHVCVWSDPGTANYDVTMELWTDDGTGQAPLASIPGTACSVSGLPPGTVWNAAAPCDFSAVSGVKLPDRVWMALTFSTNDAGWTIQDQAELGFTDDFVYHAGHLDYGTADFYAGFCTWIYAQKQAPPGPCCLADGSCIDLDPAECEGIGWPVEQCPEDGVCIPPGDDCWNTPCGDTQYSFAKNPIPADFFGPGSATFDGKVKLGGASEGGPTEFADTIISRREAAAPEIGGDDQTIEIELVALSLKSCGHITVKMAEGPVAWDVEVSLSETPVPLGEMEIRKKHANGGTFRASFNVQAVFTFTRVDDPLDVRVLDPADLGKPPALLETIGATAWVHEDPSGEVVPKCSTVNFIAGVDQDPLTLNMTCVPTGHAGPGHMHVTGQICVPKPEGACCNTANGSCMLAMGEADCNGVYKGDGTDCRDNDGDGLADWFETNDCNDFNRNECNTGTDPNNPDTDGDGLLDGFELKKTKCDPCVADAVDTDGDGIGDTCGEEHYVKFSQPPKSGEAVCNNDPFRLCTTDADCWFCIGGPDDGQACNGDLDCSTMFCDPGVCVLTGPPGEDYPSDLDWTDDHPNQVAADDFVSDGRPITAVRWWGSNIRKKPPLECVPPGQDEWNTHCGASVYDFTKTPIPADFFEPGSEPFTDVVQLEGASGGSDTLVERKEEMCFVGQMPVVDQTAIYLKALDLIGCQSITVIVNGQVTLWDLTVFLDGLQKQGKLTATMTDAAGGTFDAILPVQAGFSFTKVAGPGIPLGSVVVLLPGVQQPLTSTEIRWWKKAPWGGGCIGFCPGDYEPPCCPKRCHSAGAAHDHCVTPVGCPPCSAVGACCRKDVAGGSCEDDVLASDCPRGPQVQWRKGVLCDDLDPPCAEHTGACCNAAAPGGSCVDSVPESLCDPSDPQFTWYKDAPCAAIICMEHIGACCDKLGGICTDDVPEGDCGAPGWVKGLSCVEIGCGPDCNLNGISDLCDIDCGPPAGECDVPGCGGSGDCNENAIPDECEPDCNENGVPDDCDIANGTSPDSNGNGIPDECEVYCCLPFKGCFVEDPAVCAAQGGFVVLDCVECPFANSVPGGAAADDDSAGAVSIAVTQPPEPSNGALRSIRGGADRGAAEWLTPEGEGAPVVRFAKVTWAEMAAIRVPDPAPDAQVTPLLQVPPQEVDEATGEAEPREGLTPGGVGEGPSLRAPPLTNSFQGTIDDGTAIPPDTHGAVGPNHVVEILNSGFTIFDRGGGVVAPQITLQQFWGALGFAPGQPASIPFDPKVLYDQYADRWVVVADGNPDGRDGTTNSWLLVAISQTNTPTGLWHLYPILSSILDGVVDHRNDWCDYPGVGLDPNNIIVSKNMYSVGAHAWRHADLWVIDKASMMAGAGPLVQGVDYRLFHDPCGTGSGVFQPCHTFGQTPANAINHLVDSGWSSGARRFVRVKDVTGIGAGAALNCRGGNDWVEVAPYNRTQLDAPQPLCDWPIETNDPRLLNAVFWKGRIWTTHSVAMGNIRCVDGPNAGLPCNSDADCPPPGACGGKTEVAWYEIDPAAAGAFPGGVPNQQGRVSDLLRYYYFPSIAVNKDSCVALGFSGSDSNTFASAYYTVHDPAVDAPGMTQAVSLLKAGVDSYLQTWGLKDDSNRWGDYSATVVDPRDFHTFWTVQEYAEDQADGLPPKQLCGLEDGTWGTWWGSFQCENSIDGWFISFHEPLQKSDPQDEPLALYFCNPKVVDIQPTKLPDCQQHNVFDYFVNLEDCCLVHSNIDSRTGYEPAMKNGFYEEKGLAYHIDIQAVAGVQYWQDKETGDCLEKKTGKGAFDHFWGWHTTVNENGIKSALQTSVKMGPSGEWLYGPWYNIQPKCSFPNMSFELLTNTPTEICKEKCCQCAPGPHWVDTCGPGTDRMKSGALVGISLSGDCVEETTLVLGGPVMVEKSGPLDDSIRFPGERAIDGHLDVIDTEITTMRLTGVGGITLTAGAKHGLRPTYGVIAEQPGDDTLADSFFDVFFEVALADGRLVYNHNPLRIEAKISCVPPKGPYFHPIFCPPIPLYDTRKPDPSAVIVAYLVTAEHEPFVKCGSHTAGRCLVPNGTPYCDDYDCCETVCDPAQMPECCTGPWDQACADKAAMLEECAQLLPPVLPPNVEHHARKHRYISIDATTNPNVLTTLKVEIEQMWRCAGDLRRSCVYLCDGGPRHCHDGGATDGLNCDADPNICGPGLPDECYNHDGEICSKDPTVCHDPAICVAECPDVCQADPDLHSCGNGAICPDGICIPTGPCVPHPDVGLSWFVQPPVTRQHQPDNVSYPCPGNMCDEEDYYARVDAGEYASDWQADCQDPHIPNWTDGCKTLHIGDCEIVPGVKYNVYACLPGGGTCSEPPLVVETTRKPNGAAHYGDVSGGVTPLLVFEPPDGFVNVRDISAYLLTNQNWGTPILPQCHPTWIDLHGPGPGIPPQYVLNVVDLTMIKRAWVNAWPYENSIGGLAPGDCP